MWTTPISIPGSGIELEDQHDKTSYVWEDSKYEGHQSGKFLPREQVIKTFFYIYFFFLLSSFTVLPQTEIVIFLNAFSFGEKTNFLKLMFDKITFMGPGHIFFWFCNFNSNFQNP